jgi:hypothetical protein
MDIDEEALTRFFGQGPEPVGDEEREFFGSITYRLEEGPYVLTLGLNTNFGDASVHLKQADRDEPILQSALSNIAAVRAEESPAVLTLLGTIGGTSGADPDLRIRATLTLDPIALRLEDGSE